MKKILIALLAFPLIALAQNPQNFTPPAFNDLARVERIKNAMPVIEKCTRISRRQNMYLVMHME